LLTYYLKEKPDQKSRVAIEILDETGKVVRELTSIPREAGFNRTSWDLGEEGPGRRRSAPEGERGGGGTRGHAVLPGTYTIRLVVGDEKQDRKIQVTVDPMVSVSAAALREQYEMAVTLRDLITAANKSLRKLDGVSEQLRQIEKTVREQMTDPPAALLTAIKAESKVVEEMIGKMVAPRADGLGYRGSSQIVDQLSSLYFSIQGVNAGPTPAQKEYLSELQPRATAVVSEAEKLINERIPKLNELLRQHNGPIIVTGQSSK
jgi:hypothetical protein